MNIYNLGCPIFGTYTCPICNKELMKSSLWFIHLCQIYPPTLRNSNNHLSLNRIIEGLQRGDEDFILTLCFNFSVSPIYPIYLIFVLLYSLSLASLPIMRSRSTEHWESAYRLWESAYRLSRWSRRVEWALI